MLHHHLPTVSHIRILQRAVRSTTVCRYYANAAVAVAQPPAEPVAVPAKPRKYKIPTRRANISLARPRKWHRPLREGFLPAYDEALKVIHEDSVALKAEAAQLRKTVKAKEADVEAGNTVEGLAEDMERLKMLDIQSEINLPSVRWKFANGMADLTKPVYRHLAEQRWRTTGALDLLMERVYQMHVVPDLLPSVHPSFDLRVNYPEPPPANTYLRTRVKRKYKQVEPGIFLLPEQTRRPPRLYATAFHPETRYYTMVLIDADVPDPDNQSFTTYLHWMQPNIPLSATSSTQIPSHPHTRYIPPHPQNGSPYHRYCLFFLPHVNSTEQVNIPVVSESDRLGFSLRKLCAEYGFDASKGGAVHMWREVWDTTVSDIYSETLKIPEPRYGLPPKAAKYTKAAR